MDAFADPAPSPFAAGLLLGSAPWLEQLLSMLDPSAAAWSHRSDSGVPELAGVDVVVDATPLEDAGVTAALADAVMAMDEPPACVILVVGDEWLGTNGSLAAAARSAAALALGRGLALRLAAAGTTVNAVAVPPGFPHAIPPATAPIQHEVGLAELAHILAFFADPENDYVTGQVLSLSGGDTTWSNLSL